MIRSTSSPVPTGTVDLVTTTVNPETAAAISRAAVMDVTEIGMAVAAPRRRADGDEHRLGLGDRPGEVGGEIEPPLARIGGHETVEVRSRRWEFRPRASRAILPASLSTQVT